MKLSTDQLILAPDAAIDLQLHTIYSDGRWTPEQLIDYLISEGFGLAAITDHDRVDTLVKLQHLALEKGFPLLVAAEITTRWKGKPVDVLCFGFDPENNVLGELTADILRRQQDNTRKVVAALRQKGHSISDEELDIILNKPGSSQPHELYALIEMPGGADAWDELVKAEIGFATVEIAAAVEAVHKSGGVCLIAHPGRSDGYVCFDVELLDDLRREVPIDGFEVYYPVHTPEQIEMYRDYAERYDLLTSAGSDSHGLDKKPVKYPAHQSKKLLACLNIEVR